MCERDIFSSWARRHTDYINTNANTVSWNATQKNSIFGPSAVVLFSISYQSVVSSLFQCPCVVQVLKKREKLRKRKKLIFWIFEEAF